MIEEGREKVKEEEEIDMKMKEMKEMVMKSKRDEGSVRVDRVMLEEEEMMKTSVVVLFLYRIR